MKFTDGLKRALKAASFRKDGQPRTWLAHLLLKNQKSGEPRFLLSRAIFKKNGCVRLLFSDWYERYLLDSSSARFAPYLSFIRGQISSGRLASATSLHIVSTPHTAIVGEAIAEALKSTRLTVSRALEMPQDFSHDLYLIVAPQMFNRMPPAAKTIFMQVEQVRASSWITPKYLQTLNDSLGILDYSQNNISALKERGLPNRQLIYVPLLPASEVLPSTSARDIDVLFYGAVNSARREKYIEALSEKFNIRVETNDFASSIWNNKNAHSTLMIVESTLRLESTVKALCEVQGIALPDASRNPQ